VPLGLSGFWLALVFALGVTPRSLASNAPQQDFHRVLAQSVDKQPVCNDRPLDSRDIGHEWFWLDNAHCHRTIQDLRNILNGHQLWLTSAKKAGHRANFTGANLTFANLSGIDLREVAFCPDPGIYIRCAVLSHANLQNTKLRSLFGAKLVGAELEEADLRGADLTGADLTEAILQDADLSGAYLWGAVLTNADLSRANLSGTNLEGAKLDQAHLTDTELRDAKLTSADLTDAIFEPKSNPITRGIASARGLASMDYDEDPDALFQLRKQLEEAGFARQARQITYVLMHADASDHRRHCHLRSIPDCISYAFNTAFFDWTCLYGMQPGRPLLLLAASWFVLSLIYLLFMHLCRTSGI